MDFGKSGLSKLDRRGSLRETLKSYLKIFQRFSIFLALVPWDKVFPELQAYRQLFV